MSGQGQELLEQPTSSWIIRKKDTRMWLGTKDQRSNRGTSFGGRIPLFYNSHRAVSEAWTKYCISEGYLQRGVSLGGLGSTTEAGPNASLMPDVEFVLIDFEHRGTVGPDQPPSSVRSLYDVD